MELFKRTILIVLSVLCFIFCGSSCQIKMDFPQEIVQNYYETIYVDNQRQVVMVNLHMELNQPLSKGISLQKLYFRNHEATVEKVSEKEYVAHFPQTAAVQDFILDSDSKREYGNKVPIIFKPKFELSKDEAVLEYKKNNKTIFFKLTEINEKE